MSGRLQLAVESLRLDGGTQSRARLNDETVEDYAALYEGKGATPLPPVVVFYDGADHWLADGFHCVYAARKAGRSRVPVTIHQGSKRDAVLYSVGANADHGLRRTNADKRRAVELLLKDEEWGKRSDRWIAEKCGVSQPFVGKLKAEAITVITSEPKHLGKDGKSYPASKPAKQTTSRLALVPVESNGDDSPDEPEIADDAPDQEPDALERDKDTALIELDQDIDRHLRAWRWSATSFVTALEGWARRSRIHFEREEGRKANG